MNHQGFGICHIGEIGENFQLIDKLTCIRGISFDMEGKDGTCPLREIFLSQIIVRARWQTRIVDLFHLRMTFEEVDKATSAIKASIRTDRGAGP